MTPVIKEEQMTTLERKIKDFSRILADRPGDELTVLALAEASFRRGFKLEALTAYQELGTRAVPEAHLAVAEIYFDQGMPSEAYGELRKLFQLDPDNVEARLLMYSLQAEALPPEDMRAVLDSAVSEQAIEEAKLRLKIQRTIFHRELQERTRNVTLEPGKVIHEYHMEEAKKKLIRVDELLRDLERFADHNATLVAGPPRPEMVSAQVDAEAPALEVSAELTAEAGPEQAPLDEQTGEPISDEFETASLPNLVESAAGEPVAQVVLDSSEPELLAKEPSLTPAQESSLELFSAGQLSQAPDEGSVSSEMEFHLSVESPLAPDLPELELVPEAGGVQPGPPAMVDLEPIDMSGEISDTISMDFPTPAFREVSVPAETANTHLVMPMLDEDSTLILSPTSLEDPPSPKSAEPIPAPELEQPEVEKTPPALESEDEPCELSPARQSFYAASAEVLSGLTTTLARTRGVTSIFLVAREGVTIDAVAKDDISQERVGELVRESFEFLEAFSKDPAYWVLECAGGIFVMQKLDERHVLIAIGQAGANFGALRYTMDRTRTKFEQVLAQVPE